MEFSLGTLKACALAASSLQYDGSFAEAHLDWKTRQEVLKRLTSARNKARQAWYLTYGSNDDDEKPVGIWRRIPRLWVLTVSAGERFLDEISRALGSLHFMAFLQAVVDPVKH